MSGPSAARPAEWVGMELLADGVIIEFPPLIYSRCMGDVIGMKEVVGNKPRWLRFPNYFKQLTRLTKRNFLAS